MNFLQSHSAINSDRSGSHSTGDIMAPQVPFRVHEQSMRTLSKYLDRPLTPPRISDLRPPGESMMLHVMGQPINPRQLYASVCAAGGYQAVNQSAEGWTKIAEAVGLPGTSGTSARVPALAVRSAYEANLLRYERQQQAILAIAPAASAAASVTPPPVPVTSGSPISYGGVGWSSGGTDAGSLPSGTWDLKNFPGATISPEALMLDAVGLDPHITTKGMPGDQQEAECDADIRLIMDEMTAGGSPFISAMDILHLSPPNDYPDARTLGSDHHMLVGQQADHPPDPHSVITQTRLSYPGGLIQPSDLTDLVNHKECNQMSHGYLDHLNLSCPLPDGAGLSGFEEMGLFSNVSPRSLLVSSPRVILDLGGTPIAPAQYPLGGTPITMQDPRQQQASRRSPSIQSQGHEGYHQASPVGSLCACPSRSGAHVGGSSIEAISGGATSLAHTSPPGNRGSQMALVHLQLENQRKLHRHLQQVAIHSVHLGEGLVGGDSPYSFYDNGMSALSGRTAIQIMAGAGPSPGAIAPSHPGSTDMGGGAFQSIWTQPGGSSRRSRPKTGSPHDASPQAKAKPTRSSATRPSNLRSKNAVSGGSGNSVGSVGKRLLAPKDSPAGNTSTTSNPALVKKSRTADASSLAVPEEVGARPVLATLQMLQQQQEQQLADLRVRQEQLQKMYAQQEQQLHVQLRMGAIAGLEAGTHCQPNTQEQLGTAEDDQLLMTDVKDGLSSDWNF